MILLIAQIVVALLLIILILLQERSSGLSGIFGGDSGGVYQTRRGAENMIFYGTIVLSLAFAGLALANLIF
jgi:protein translocase SecG subunit